MSLLVGGMLGVMAGWVFSSATTKQREANDKLSEVSKAQETIVKKKGEAKKHRKSSVADKIQCFLLYVLGFMLIFILVVILFGALA